MLSFHNDPKIKEKYLSRIAAHRAADEIIKGQYWERGKGCAVGCTIHSAGHERYETELGLPEWLARLEDKIFEHMPDANAKNFPHDFLQAIPVGVNLEPVRWSFCAFMLKENIERVLSLSPPLDDAIETQVVSSIRGVLAVLEQAMTDGVLNRADAWSAESAAWTASRTAAWSARTATWTAARSASRTATWTAESAAWSAESAVRSVESAAWTAARSTESATESAGWSADSAAYSARATARATAYQRFAAELLRLLAAIREV